ncbi:aspartate kinase, partial [Mesorhizobium sp. M00.F.Ca.ET.186.01.1.1]
MKVAKFGGTSLANAEQIKKVCSIVLADRDRRLVVVSAPGKRHKEDTKVTDLLISYANRFLQQQQAGEEKQAVFARYEEIIAELGLGEAVAEQIKSELDDVLNNRQGLSAERFMDAAKAAGEDTCAKI